MRERKLAGPPENKIEADRQHGVHHQHIAEIKMIDRQYPRQYKTQYQNGAKQSKT